MATLKMLVTGIVVASNKLSKDLSELEPVTAACILQDAENLYDLLMCVTDYDDADEPAAAPAEPSGDPLQIADTVIGRRIISGEDEEESE